MTSFISALLSAIMLMTGIGSGSVTINNIAVTVGDETFPLDPAITAAYCVDEGSAAVEAYVTLDDQQLFKTDLSLVPSGLTVNAAGSVITLTDELFDAVLAQNNITAEDLLGSIPDMAGITDGFDMAQMQAMGTSILAGWSESFESEPVVETVNGEEVTLNHISGTVGSEEIFSTIDTVYRTLLGDQTYEMFVNAFKNSDPEMQFNEISDIYRAMGMNMSMDIDAVVNEEYFGKWDIDMNFEAPIDQEEGTTAVIDMIMHIETESADRATCDISIAPTAEVPVTLVCTAVQDGKNVAVNYTVTVNDDDEEALINFTLNTTGETCDFTLSADTEATDISLAFNHTADKGHFEFSNTRDSIMIGALSFDMEFNTAAMDMNADNAMVITSPEQLNDMNPVLIAGGYLGDFMKLMNNDSVKALAANFQPNTEAEVGE